MVLGDTDIFARFHDSYKRNKIIKNFTEAVVRVEDQEKSTLWLVCAVAASCLASGWTLCGRRAPCQKKALAGDFELVAIPLMISMMVVAKPASLFPPNWG